MNTIMRTLGARGTRESIEAASKTAMKDLRTLALEALVRRAAGQLGYPRLKPKQLEAVTKFCQGRDVFASLPTSYGKTLIYALLPSIFNSIRGRNSSIVVVLSPLVALMVEQKKRFLPIGINAEFLGELQTDEEAVGRVVQGRELVLVSPENLCYNRTLREMLLSSVYKENLVALVVDEAHCIRTW